MKSHLVLPYVQRAVQNGTLSGAQGLSHAGAPGRNPFQHETDARLQFLNRVSKDKDHGIICIKQGSQIFAKIKFHKGSKKGANVRGPD
eukprot:90530-Amphidinium_carterae.1